MNSNKIQIGGNHYKKLVYQAWDFITDMQMPFLVGSAVKYVVRFKDKSGLTDLKKAIHYLEKAVELNIQYSKEDYSMTTSRFCNQLDYTQELIIRNICVGNFQRAADRLKQLISDIEIGKSTIE